MEEAAAPTTSRLAFVECGAAFVRAHRDGRVPTDRLTGIVDDFELEWQQMAIVELGDEISRRAVTLVRDRPLRASDAIHLASALAVAPPSGGLTFACFDRKLWDAAGAFGLDRLPTTPP